MWIEVISKYWSQIAVILAAIGYILKVIFDYRFKKREIIYSYYASEKLKAINDFFEEYSAVSLSANRANAALKINIPGNKQHFENELYDKFESYSKAYAKLTFYFDENELNECKEITRNVHKIALDYIRLQVQQDTQVFEKQIGDLFERNQQLITVFSKEVRAKIGK